MSPFGVESQAQRKSRKACLDKIRVKLPSLPFPIYSSEKNHIHFVSARMNKTDNIGPEMPLWG